MSANTLLISIFAVLQVLLLIWASWVLLRSTAYTRGQRAAQFSLAVCIPLLGALLVLFMARGAVEAFPPPTASKFTTAGE